MPYALISLRTRITVCATCAMTKWGGKRKSCHMCGKTTKCSCQHDVGGRDKESALNLQKNRYIGPIVASSTRSLHKAAVDV